MTAFVLRRLLGGVGTFVAATAVVFVLVFALPGDPARAIIGRRDVPPATLEAVRSRYGLDEPLPERYLRWLGGLASGDLGESSSQRRPVTTVLVDTLPTTARLLVLTLPIEVALAVGGGVAGALRHRRDLDHAVVVVGTAALAVPSFVLASVAQLVVGVRLDWIPVAGDTSWWGLVVPAIVLALPGAAMGSRLLRAEMLERRHDRHAVVAASKGMRRSTLVRRHVVRNSLGTLVSFTGTEIGALAAGTIIVERVFNLPGVGGAIARAISQRDVGLIIGFTVVTIALYVIVDVAVDVAAMVLDPRLRAR